MESESEKEKWFKTIVESPIFFKEHITYHPTCSIKKKDCQLRFGFEGSLGKSFVLYTFVIFGIPHCLTGYFGVGDPRHPPLGLITTHRYFPHSFKGGERVLAFRPRRSQYGGLCGGGGHLVQGESEVPRPGSCAQRCYFHYNSRVGAPPILKPPDRPFAITPPSYLLQVEIQRSCHVGLAWYGMLAVLFFLDLQNHVLWYFFLPF